MLMDKELTSAANRGRADGGGICYALLCQLSTIAVSLPSNTIYLAITLTIFNNGSICPRKEFTLLCTVSIFPPTDGCFYFFLIFIDFSAAPSFVPLSQVCRDFIPSIAVSFLSTLLFCCAFVSVCMTVCVGSPISRSSLLKYTKAYFGNLH